MAFVTLPAGFNVGTPDPIDNRLVLTKEQMKSINPVGMPDVYLTVCKDDGKIYLFNQNNDVDEELGKFRLYVNELDDSYLSRAKETNPNALFDDKTSLVYGTDNLNGGFKINKTVNLELDTRNPTINEKYGFEIVNNEENFIKIRNTIINRFDEFRNETYYKSSLADCDVFNKNNGWYFDITDMGYIEGSRSHPYISILIKFKLQESVISKNSALIGEGLQTTKDGSVIFGKFNKTSDAALVIGNGTDDIHRTDSLVITNEGEIKAHEYYKDDVLFQSDYSKEDLTDSTTIINKPVFNAGLDYNNHEDTFTVKYFNSNHEPITGIQGYGFIHIILKNPKKNYNKIIFKGTKNDNPFIIDLLKTPENTEIYYVSAGQYGSSSLRFIGFIDDYTIELSNSPTIGGPFQYTITPYLHTVDVNVDNVWIAINDENKISLTTSAKSVWQDINNHLNAWKPVTAPPTAADNNTYAIRNNAWITLPKLSDTVVTAVNEDGDTELRSVVDLSLTEGLLKFNNGKLNIN